MKAKRIRLWIVLACVAALVGIGVFAIVSAPLAKGSLGDGIAWELKKDGELVIRGTGEIPDRENANAEWELDQYRDRVKRISIGEGITGIGDHAFFRFAMAEEAVLPEGVIRIGKGAFRNCELLAAVRLPETLEEIDEDAFSECYRLQNLRLPDSVTRIGKRAFDDCLKLEAVDLPPKMTEIESSTFIGSRLKRVTIPEGVKRIGAGAFRDCSLESVTLPAGLEAIGSHAFAYNKPLSGTVSLSASVTEIGEEAFEGCESLEGIAADAGNPRYESRADGALFARETNTLLWCPSGLTAGCENLAPAGFKPKDNEDPPAGTLDAKAALKKEGLRLFPMSPYRHFSLEMYNMMPEEVRTYSLAEADYAIVPAVSYHARHDYVYEKTKNKAGGVYNTKTHIYLAAADGSYGELCYITHEPAKKGRSDQRLTGATADAEEIWEAVRKRIP